jgi:hypothetical protein
MKTMETLSEAMQRLELAGYQRCFRAHRDGLLEATGDPPVRVRPEDMVVDEMVRFEGQSNPGDEAVLFALRSYDGSSKGTFVSNFGPGTEPADVAAIHRLDVRTAREGPREA